MNEQDQRQIREALALHLRQLRETTIKIESLLRVLIPPPTAIAERAHQLTANRLEETGE